MARDRLILFLSYSRSGGTLLAKCLEAMGEVFVLSEVHPQYVTGGNLISQVKKRLDVEINDEQYIDQLKTLSAYLKKVGKTLCVRDWSFIDFTPHPINGNTPSNKLMHYDLLKAHFDVECFAVIRNPIDIWISRKCPPRFFEIYPNYIRELKASSVPIFKYEAFCKRPKKVMKDICNAVKLRYNEGFLNAFNSIDIQGDKGLRKDSRGAKLSSIEPLKRKRIPRALQRKMMREYTAGRIKLDYGYTISDEDTEIENTPSYIGLNFRHFMDCIRGKYPRDIF